MVTRAMRRNSTGMDRRMSTKRMASESTQPPKKPEAAP